MEFVFINFLTDQRTVGAQERHLAYVALVVVLVDLATSKSRSGNWKILILSLGAFNVVLRGFQQHTLIALNDVSAGAGDLDHLSSHPPNWTVKTVARTVTITAYRRRLRLIFIDLRAQPVLRESRHN